MDNSTICRWFVQHPEHIETSIHHGFSCIFSIHHCFSYIFSLFIMVSPIFSRDFPNVWGHRSPLGLMLFPSIDLHLPNRASIFHGHLSWENGDSKRKTQWKTHVKMVNIEWFIISASWWFLWWFIVVNNGYIIVANSDFHDAYNWWFLWDKQHSINRVMLVLITGKGP